MYYLNEAICIGGLPQRWVDTSFQVEILKLACIESVMKRAPGALNPKCLKYSMEKNINEILKKLYTISNYFKKKIQNTV